MSRPDMQASLRSVPGVQVMSLTPGGAFDLSIANDFLIRLLDGCGARIIVQASSCRICCRKSGFWLQCRERQQLVGWRPCRLQLAAGCGGVRLLNRFAGNASQQVYERRTNT